MTPQLSQPTLGLLRKVLEGMEPSHAIALPDRKKFWKDQLFDFGFAPAVIEIVVSYEFRWGDIISDLFIGKFGPQNQHFANALSPYFCDQTLNRLLALALHEGNDPVLLNELDKSLKRDGIKVSCAESPKQQSSTKDPEEQISTNTDWPTTTQQEILKHVVRHFLETNEPTSRIVMVKQFGGPDIVDDLAPVILRNPTGEKLFPTAIAFQCCGDESALQAAQSAVQLVIRTLQELFASSGAKTNFTIDEIEEQARLIVNTQPSEFASTGDRAAVQFGLYLVQDFRAVHAGIGGAYPNITHVVAHERIGSKNAATAWKEHVEQYRLYLESRGKQSAPPQESVKQPERPIQPVSPAGGDAMQPFKVLTEAIRAVPAVKYALGIAGVIAVIAIVKGFGVDYRVAALGVVVMLVLMTALVIFAKLTSKHESVFHWPAIILTWFALVLTMATAVMLFSSVFWGKPLELRYKPESSPSSTTGAQPGGQRAVPPADSTTSPQQQAYPVLAREKVCEFYGEANSGSSAWNKDEACVIPKTKYLDTTYRQSDFNCCGGGAASPTTSFNIPAGLELIVHGGHYWSVQAPRLDGDRFFLHTYCGPEPAGGPGCNVNVQVFAHYRQ
jgi:hypothetical protein